MHGFVASADFAIDKPPGVPCVHLQGDARCGIHASLRVRGFPGCVAYDCFGAGQRACNDFPDDPHAAFPALRQLHELLWYLREARTLLPDDARLADLELQTLAYADFSTVDAHRARVNSELSRASAALRAGLHGREWRGRDLAGKDLRRVRLTGANLRGAVLIGANLRAVDLTRADFTGADLRGAQLQQADLRAALFLTQPQIESAAGDPHTVLPPALTRPHHWLAGPPA